MSRSQYDQGQIDAFLSVKGMLQLVPLAAPEDLFGITAAVAEAMEKGIDTLMQLRGLK